MLTERLKSDTNTINYHLKEIFKASELNEDSVIRKFRITANDGKNYHTSFYNLDNEHKFLYIEDDPDKQGWNDEDNVGIPGTVLI